MNEQDASRILSTKLTEAEHAITSMIESNTDEDLVPMLERYTRMSEASGRWFPRRKLTGLLASYAIMKGMRLAGRM